MYVHGLTIYHWSVWSQILTIHLSSPQTLPPPPDEDKLIDYLKPNKFDFVVKVTLQCAASDMDDVEDLESPSNAIKLGFEIKCLIGAKKGFAIRACD